jgi:hypothetical protein
MPATVYKRRELLIGGRAHRSLYLSSIAFMLASQAIGDQESAILVFEPVQ